MNIRDLQYIVAIHKHRSFIKASKECFVSQPALSMQIQKIESLLGVKIFERNKRNVITTPEGAKIINYANTIIDTFDLIKKVKDEGSTIKVGLIHTISSYLLPKVIAKIQDANKDPKILFFEEKTKSLIGDLKSGKLDGVLVASNEAYFSEDLGATSNIEAKILYEEGFALVMHSSAPFECKGERMTKEELQEFSSMCDLILLEEVDSITEHIRTIATEYGIRFNQGKTSLFTSNVETIIKMILRGTHASILPKAAVANIDGVKCFDLPNLDMGNVYFLHKKNSSKMQNLSEAYDLIKSVI